MNNSITEQIRDCLEELNRKIRADNLEEWIEDLEETKRLFISGEKLQDFQESLYWVEKELPDGEEKKKIKRIKDDLRKKQYSFLIEQLKDKGYKVRGNNGIKKAIENQLYRLIQQVRLGKKDEVMFILMTCFTGRDKFPEEIVTLLKYEDVGLFKCGMYAFLSAFTELKENKNQEVKNE